MRRLSSWVDERSAPVTATTIVVAAGLVYTVMWSALARHGWQSVSDLWNSADIGLAIAHGHWATVYGPGSQLDAPPGLEFALAPFMALGHALGLRTAAEMHHGYAVFWLVLVPVVTVLASSVLFALDAVARRWRFSDAERLGLSLVAGVGVVSAVVFWGHPEDCVALAFVLWAALAVERDGSAGLARAGWLLGLAVAFQPLALLAAAPVVARYGWRALPGFAVSRGAAERRRRPPRAGDRTRRARCTRSWTSRSSRPTNRARPSATWRAPSGTGCTAAGPCGWWRRSPPWCSGGWPAGTGTTCRPCSSSWPWRSASGSCSRASCSASTSSR